MRALHAVGYIHRVACNALHSVGYIHRVAYVHCMCCVDYSISINDHNYYALQVTKERLFTAREKAQAKQWQFNMARQQVSTKQNEFARQTMILAKICNGFFDILPFCMYPQRPDSDDPIITYTGTHRLVGRVQELAKSLYHFITGTNPAGGYTRMI